MKKDQWDDDDLRAIRDEIAEARERERTAKKAASDKRKREVQAAENRATKLGIPVGDLKRAIKLLALQDELNEMAGNVPDDSAETVADMVKALGEFADTPLGSAALGAADRRVGSIKDAAAQSDAALAESIAATQAQEQREGEAVLNGAVH